MDVEEIGSDEEDSVNEPEAEEDEEEAEDVHVVEGGEEEEEVEAVELEEDEEEEEEEEEGVQVHEQALGEELDLHGLNQLLGIELEVLESLANSDQRFSHVMSVFIQLLNRKTDLIEEYEATVHQFSENLSTADQALRKLPLSTNGGAL